MPASTRMSIPYPPEFSEEWWTTFVQLIDAVDGHHFASFEDRNLFFTGGGTWTWDATSGLLEWDDTLRLNTPSTGLPQDLVAGSLTLADGECMVVDVTRGGTSAVTLAAAADTTLDPDDAVVALCLRSGDSLYFRNGVVLGDGDAYAVFDSGRNETKVDHADSFDPALPETTFVLSFTPHASCLPLVFVDGVLQREGNLNAYTIAADTVTFDPAVGGGVWVEVRYWT